jgi:hypothetical protein
VRLLGLRPASFLGPVAGRRKIGSALENEAQDRKEDIQVRVQAQETAHDLRIDRAQMLGADHFGIVAAQKGKACRGVNLCELGPIVVELRRHAGLDQDELYGMVEFLQRQSKIRDGFDRKPGEIALYRGHHRIRHSARATNKEQCSERIHVDRGCIR